MKRASTAMNSQDEIHRLGTLFNRAVSSSSNREKNQLLIQLRKIATENISRFEELTVNSGIKSRDLAISTKKVVEAKANLDYVKDRVELLKALMEKGKKIESGQIINEIKQIEEELSTFAPLEKPESMNNLLNKKLKPEMESVMLCDFKLQRLEDLIYMLQRRIVSVEQNQECSESILQEFGSIFGLIDVYKTLQIENQKLKREEVKYIDDSIAKRYHFADMNPGISRDFAYCYQQDLSRQTEILSSYQTSTGEALKSASTATFKPKINSQGVSRNLSQTSAFQKNLPASNIDFIIENQPDFETVVIDKNFIMSTDVSQGPSMYRERSSSSFHSSRTPSTYSETVDELKNQIRVAEEQNEKLESDLNELRKVKLTPEASWGNRLARLVELNNTLMAKLTVIQNNITKINNINHEKIEKLVKILLEKSHHEQVISNAFRPYRSILRDHYTLRSNMLHNTAIMHTMFGVSSRFAVEIFGDIDPKQSRSPIYTYLAPLCNEDVDRLFIETQKRRREEEERRRKEEEEAAKNPKKIIPSFSFSNKKNEIKKVRMENMSLANLITEKPITSFGSSSSIMETALEFIKESTPKQAIDQFVRFGLVTNLAQTNAFLKGKTNNSHDIFLEMWKQERDDLVNILDLKLHEYSDFQHEVISTIQTASHEILIKEKSHTFTQTESDKVNDIETQTEAPESKHKPAARTPTKKPAKK